MISRLCLATFLFFLKIAAAEAQKLNRFNPEKDYEIEQIRQQNFTEANEIVQAAAADFEGLDRSHRLALQVNGIFYWRIEGTGNIQDRSRVDSLNRRVRLAFLERVELRFDPNYWDGATQTQYAGRINFVTNDPPDKELNDLEKRIIALQKKKSRPRVPATPAVRGGVLAGLRTERESFFGGVAVEVPLSLKVSLQTELSYGSIEGAPLSATLPDRNYRLQTLESSVFLKRYFNHQYPRFFGTAGVWVEQGWGALETFSPTQTLLRENKTALGVQFGIGIQFSQGLFMDVKLPVVFNKRERLLDYQNRRGASVTLGVLFGKP